MEHRQHALVKNRDEASAVRALAVENDVLALLEPKGGELISSHARPSSGLSASF
jgi:hypothetical protein